MTDPKNHPLFKEVHEDLISLFRDKLNRSNWEEIVESRINMERGAEMLERCGDAVSFAGKDVLDVGSGWGELQYELSKDTYNVNRVVGLEPHDQLLKLSKIILEGNEKTDVVQGVVEELPFDDNSFDIVFCYTVLEHVQDYKKAVDEMMRVLRPGGEVYIFMPNYLFPREGHYRITFPAMLGKTVGHWYLRLTGKNTEFYDKYVEPIYSWSFLRYLKKQQIPYRDIAAEKYKERNILFRILGALRLYVNMEFVLMKKESHETSSK